MSKAKIEKLFKHRKTVYYCEKQLGLSELSEREKATLEFIASRNGTRITDIANEYYFNDQSYSTIKRNILILKKMKLITTMNVKSNNDKRDRVLVLA
jgi:hypothetical protein